jgi:putative ABC transport system permease protein
MRIDILLQDVRHAVRLLRTAPGLSIVIVATLGLTLATIIATFAVLNAALLRQLPYREPERVAFLKHSYADSGGAGSTPLFLDFRRQARSFESISVTAPWSFNLTGSGEPERLRGLVVSADFFETLGVPAWRGRTFLPEEEQPGRAGVVVVSYGLWERRFGSDPRLIGSRLQLNGDPYEVIGIMPRGFAWGRTYGKEALGELWAPFALTAARTSESARGNEFLDVYGRLRPDVQLRDAQAELDGIVQGLRARFRNRYTVASGFRVTAVSLQEEIIGSLRGGLLLILAAVASLVLIAALNVAGLLLARATGRRRETSVRVALGASRGRLAHQIMIEAAVLVAAAGSVGLLAAFVAARAFDRIDRITLPRSQPIQIDATVAGFAFIAALAVALVSGLLPALHVSRSNLTSWLQPRASIAGGRDAARMRRVLIVAQTALALALLVQAGLLVRSVGELQRVSTGFRAENALIAQLNPVSRYHEDHARVGFVTDVLAQVAGKPNVLSAGVVSELPLSGYSNSSSFYIEGRIIPQEDKQPHAETWSATSGYFATLGIGLQRGRLFDDRDTSESAPVTVVSESLTRTYFPREDPIGKRIDFEGSSRKHAWREIVGIVSDVHDRHLERMPGPQIYVPYVQRPTGGLFLAVRSTQEALGSHALVRSAVRAVDANLPAYGFTSMDRLVSLDTRDKRAGSAALGAFAVAAMLLAAIGLYALLAQTVRERVPEIGVRMALGARSTDVLRLFIEDGGRLILFGVVAGLPIALVASRLLRGVIFGVTSTDPATYVAVGALFVIVGGAACALPAWRATRIDPLRALRE